MSYYEDKIEELRATDAEIKELGDEIALIDSEYILVGGDAPAAFEAGSEISPDQARRLAELARGTDAEAYEAYLQDNAISEAKWD